MKHRFNRPLLAAMACGSLLAFGASASAAPARPTKITISYSQKTVDHLPLLMALDAGYYKQHNLDVTVRYLPAQEGIPALLDGQVQAMSIGGSDAASAQAQGARLKLVLTLCPIYQFQFWAQPKYASATKLKGQRIAISSATGSSYAATLLALKQLGLKPSDVVMEPLGAATRMYAALLAGSVAMSAGHPPASYKFKQAGLVDLVDLAKERLPSVVSGLWFTSSFVKAHPNAVQGVVDSVLQALEDEKSNRAFAEKEIARRFHIKNKAELRYTYDFYTKEILGPGPTPKVASLQADIDALAASNPKVKQIRAAEMIDPSFLEKAEKRGIKSR
ncbi:MAG TPA: ABC transporter substrate-binding protein [Beijerinckiaceae bacterium]|nr:ABC transporter substrate-binding protein [Beijerinckiaceae bacterium]